MADLIGHLCNTKGRLRKRRPSFLPFYCARGSAALKLGKPALKAAKGAYAAELGVLVASRLASSDSPRIAVAALVMAGLTGHLLALLPYQRFCRLRAACGTGFPSQIEPHPLQHCKRQNADDLTGAVGSVFRRRKAERKLVFRKAFRKIISGRTSVRPAAEKDEYQPV